MKIAIIGAGNVGSTLGKGLAAKGHEIYYGVRDPQDPKHVSLKSSSTSIMTPPEAVKASEVILIATPWANTKQAVESCGPLTGKILVDCTNPVKSDFSGLEMGHTTSGGEMVAQWAKDAKVVKCFNHTGFENMANPDYGSQKPVMFAAGDDSNAVGIVAGLAKDIGFDAVELKGLHLARQLEQLAWLWIDIAYKQEKGKNFAFSLLKR